PKGVVDGQQYKEASKDMIMILVPRTNTRGRGEYPQASEQTIVKELGKLAPTGEDAGYPQLDGKTPWSFTAA
ncbi:2175_t:CDS:2, partial [Ambispora gerdemannii]